MSENYTAAAIADAISAKLAGSYGATPETADTRQMYHATMLALRDLVWEKRTKWKKKLRRSDGRRVCYLCMEFLTGRRLRQDLAAMGLWEAFDSALSEMGHDLSQLCGIERDPALGNGGLGRLAACFMDSLATLGYDATGFSLFYEYGLFRQRIVDGDQMELPDHWTEFGADLLRIRSDRVFPVRFGGNLREEWRDGKLHIIHEHYEEVTAIPYDLCIPGHGTDCVAVLRLWRARDPISFDMKLFSQGDYINAKKKSASNEMISAVLYPADDHEEGKILRLMQHYFLVSATCQNLLRDHLDKYGSLDSFGDKTAIHLNDTHPALAVPELMRLLMDEHGLSWEDAFGIVRRTVTYTNHTVMPEALECWREELLRMKLPRIHSIITELNRRMCAELWDAYPGDFSRISRMAITESATVHMARLSVYASSRVNGVSKLHSEILKNEVFRDFAKWTPEKFTGVTNGISHRRWLEGANPPLASLMDEVIGNKWRREPERLSEFSAYADDGGVLLRLSEIKRLAKQKLCREIMDRTGTVIDPESIFDVHVKRIHEYKRQLLGALKILSLYNDLALGRIVRPYTFIFGGKAASGYYTAKSIIKLLWCLGQQLESDPRARDVLRVVYLEDYNVTAAETVIPAADISEQISLAGKEASGTGCMKFMINGALTLGTADGANIEMAEAVGRDAIFIFGNDASQVDALWRRGYDSGEFLRQYPRVKTAVEMLRGDIGGHSFEELYGYLAGGAGSVADPYMCLADFESYMNAFERMGEIHSDTHEWYSRSARNIAAAGYFSSDRSVKEYADKIWLAEPTGN